MFVSAIIYLLRTDFVWSLLIYGFNMKFLPGFAGELCNFEYNECESNPCQNGGECIDHIGSYECHCTNGFTGSRCQIKVSTIKKKKPQLKIPFILKPDNSTFIRFLFPPFDSIWIGKFVHKKIMSRRTALHRSW